jgi:hypothetical protein
MLLENDTSYQDHHHMPDRPWSEKSLSWLLQKSCRQTQLFHSAEDQFGYSSKKRLVSKPRGPISAGRGTMKLFPFTKSEAKLLSALLERELSQANRTSEYIEARRRFVSADLRRVASIIESDGFSVYVGSVTDQEGDSTWELTSDLQQIRMWANDMSNMSYEIPRTFRVSVTRSGFGYAKPLTKKRAN